MFASQSAVQGGNENNASEIGSSQTENTNSVDSASPTVQLNRLEDEYFSILKDLNKQS